MTQRGVRWERLQRLGAAALVPLSLSLLWLHCARSPDVPFLRSDAGATWWMAPREVSARLEQWGEVEAPVTRFRTGIPLGELPERAVARIRALRHFRLWLNGEEVAVAASPDWRDPVRVDLLPRLRVGSNRLEVEVRNRRGPGLLKIGFEGLGDAAPTRWDTAVDGAERGTAIPADDTRRNPGAYTVETPLEGLVERRNALLACFVAGAAGLALAVRSRLPASVLPGTALLLASLAWIWLFLTKSMRIPARVGFDAGAHMDYVEHLTRHHALPLASEGWSMYHPPLFYVLSAALQGLGERALKVLPFVGGLSLVFLSHSLATRIYRERPRVALLATLFAATFPVALYSASYLSNEPLHAALVGVALLATVDALLARRSPMRAVAAIGLWLGLAALTKFTVLAIVPVVLVFVGLKGLAVEGLAPRRAVGRVALLAAVFLAVAGWFYARNVWHFGTPVVGNWALPGDDQVWWQQPGFHTWRYYLSFGESLQHPYLSGFASFWDGLYATLWGDGYVAGRVHPHQRHGFWSYGFMSAGYWLALPVSGLLLFGLLRLLVEALRDPDPGRRAALSFLLTASYAIGFAFVSLTLSLPFFAQAKAPYLLCLTPVLALAFGAGTVRLDDALCRPGLEPLRLLLAGLLASALGCFFLGFAA